MSIQSAHRSNDENTRPHSGAASSREADLGSAPIGALLFKLALPAIAAQIINVLYNMVDRMYIGHIPDIGPSALTGVGVTMPIIMCISAFAALAAMGGAPQASILMGKGDKDSAEKVLGNCTFMLTVISLVLTALFLGFGRPILLMFGASEKTIHENLRLRHFLRPDGARTQCLYQRTGLCQNRHDYRCHRRSLQHHPRSDLYLRTASGCARRSTCNHPFTGYFLYLDSAFSDRNA